MTQGRSFGLPFFYLGREHPDRRDYEVYSAEINVKGKVIYGYNWNTRVLSDGPGYYRITFSMDGNGNDKEIQLNTVIDTIASIF